MSEANFIEDILQTEYPDCWDEVLNLPLIQYLHTKTRSVTRGSKARGSFGNLYAIYVLVEDYVNQGFVAQPETYSQYDGMRFTDAFRRQRELPFGEKLQNHALNHRCNQEFLKYFPRDRAGEPIIRDKETKRYWINDHLITTECAGTEVNIAPLILTIIDRYVELKREGFETFFVALQELVINNDRDALIDLIRDQLNPEVDARVFEIVSFALLKLAYQECTVMWGDDQGTIKEIVLTLYKTGRTNSNDGGIDFIMRPTGRVFQVTEVLDFRKYFLDIDKVNKYPITFVIKDIRKPDDVLALLQDDAEKTYPDPDVRERYLNAIERIITIPTLEEHLQQIIESGFAGELAGEIILQCQVEFNIPGTD